MVEESKGILAGIKHLLSAPVFENEDKTRIARMLNTIVLTVLVLAVVFTIFTLPTSPEPVALSLVEGVLVLLCVCVLILMRRGRVQLASALFSLMLWVVITIAAVGSGGVRSPAFSIYTTVILIAGLLLGERIGIAFAGLSGVAGLGMLYAETHGILSRLAGANNVPQLVPIWGTLTTGFVITAAVLSLASRGINRALERARHFATELEGQKEHLEETVKERMRDLARRARYLETTTTVARDATSELDLYDLLSRVVTLISERFDFYHAGLFLLDPGREWVVLQAASSEGGRRMLAHGHQLKVGTGVVGAAVAQGQHRIALDVSAGQAGGSPYVSNPDLPETRSELALPLRARGETIGALDVQSREPEAFSAEDVIVLQTLADQVAVAISNARLFQQAQESLEAERRAYGELRSEAWGDLLRAQPDLGFLRDRQGISPAGDLWRPEMETAVQTGKTTSGGDGSTSLAIPIKVGDQVIGVVDARKPGGTGEGAAQGSGTVAAREAGSGTSWTEDEVALMETLTDQLEMALDSARIYQETQRRAARERLIGEVAGRMRETLDMDTVLQTAVREMGDALNIAAIKVRMGSGATTETKQG
jgi:GAF domain-containing protein